MSPTNNSSVFSVSALMLIAASLSITMPFGMERAVLSALCAIMYPSPLITILSAETASAFENTLNLQERTSSVPAQEIMLYAVW